MTDTTTLPDVYSVGQRRNPGGTFPPAAGGGGGGSLGDPPGRTIHQAGEDPDPPQPSDPCSHPDTALEWNADAAAAEAAKEFAKQAAARQPPEDLNRREWACYLYRAADGSIQMGPVTSGDPFANGGVGTVTPSNQGIDPATIIGSVHSHSSGSHLPSTGPGPGLEDRGDIGHVISTADWITANNGNGSVFRAYIVAQNQGPAISFPITKSTSTRPPLLRPRGKREALAQKSIRRANRVLEVDRAVYRRLSGCIPRFGATLSG